MPSDIKARGGPPMTMGEIVEAEGGFPSEAEPHPEDCCAYWKKEAEALERQVDRLQRGDTIESDYITTRELELLHQRDKWRARAEEAEQEMRWALDHEASLQRQADRDEDTYTMLSGRVIQAKRHAERLVEALRERGHTDECYSGEADGCDCPLAALAADGESVKEQPDFRPKCCRCGTRWLPPEGVDAQETPCESCRMRIVDAVHQQDAHDFPPDVVGAPCRWCGKWGPDAVGPCRAADGESGAAERAKEEGDD